MHETHRRPSAGRKRRSQAVPPQRPVAPQAGGRPQGGAVSAGATFTATASGLLIPRLAADVPRTFEGGKKVSIKWLRQLVTLGGLTPESEGDSAEELVEFGILNLLPSSLQRFEDQWYEGMVGLTIQGDGIEGSINQDCHAWRLRLRPIVTAMPAVEALAFIKALDASPVQGPHFWSELMGYWGGEDWEPWLSDKHKAFPCLTGTDQQLQLGSMEPETPSELRFLVDRFTTTATAVMKYAGQGALLCTSWDKDCPVNHAHDQVLEAIQDGSIDNQDAPAFAFKVSTLPQLKQAWDTIGAFIEAATNLEEWTNAQC